MATEQVKKLENLKGLLTEALAVYTNNAELLNSAKEVKRKKWLLNRQKIVELILANGDNISDNEAPKPFGQKAQTIVTDFKVLQTTIKKNLEDLESDEQDVALVMTMVNRIEEFEQEYDSLAEAQQLKLAKYRDPIKQRVAPALEGMLKEVKKYLKIKKKVESNKAKNSNEAKSQLSDLEARLAALEASLAEN